MTGEIRDVVVLTNPTAGRGRALRVRDEALPRLRGAGWRVRPITGRNADDAAELGRKALADGADALLVCGGDGMVNLGLQLVAGTEVPLGILPAGSGNDVARYLGIPRRDGAAAAAHLLGASPTPIDLARVGERYFATVLAAGFDAVVSERANRMRWPRGQMRYNLATLAELRAFSPRTYRLDLDGAELHTRATLVAVGNGPSFGGGLRIAEGADLHDGLLDVVVIRPLTRPDLVRTYPKLFRGTHVHHPQYERHRVTRVTVAAPDIVGYADGERFGALPLTVESVPSAIRVLA
ncbi:diacylglycerol kinase [Nocardioides sp. YIM 152588]|uniref:diacylglycerol kinase n=1 Tax=Nocardioides sp. YIM 152588 TaxID=3158259 RepID=UPI0032E5108F